MLLRDKTSRRVLYAPLQGEAFEKTIPADTRKTLPDSIILLLEDGRILTKTSAVVWLLRDIGGFWRAIGHLLWVVPRPVRNLGYDMIGAIRNALFQRPDALCPVIPADMRSRFLA